VTLDLERLVNEAAEKHASDIFLKQDSPPLLRVRGEVHVADGHPTLTAEDAKEIAYGLMSPAQTARFESQREMDLGLTFKDITRLRINVFQERGAVGLVMRLIPLDIYTIDELLLPSVLKEIVKKKMGLILVTGPTGCGKSTTLAAMLEEISSFRNCTVITIEDPLEFIHKDKHAVFIQREVAIDTESFNDALKYVVRQSPDVILIGEMRDVETFSVAMTAAETGHLVFSTVHTRSAAETIDRIINMFPPYDKPQICLRLSESLIAVVTQKLLPRADGTGRVSAMEIMIVTPTIGKLIDEGKPDEVYDSIREGGFWGMQTMNQALDYLVKQGLVTEEIALENAGNFTELRQMLRR